MAKMNSIVVILASFLCMSAYLKGHDGCVSAQTIPILEGNLIDVQIGTPAQKFRMLLDTGSANTWVFSQNYQKSHLDPINRFDQTKSTTFKADEDGAEKSWAYDREIKLTGLQAKDDVKLCDIEAKQQPIGLVEGSDGWLATSIRFDGSIGLGSLIDAENHDQEASNIVLNAANQQQLENKLFSLHFEKRPKGEQVGQLVLGSSDEKFYEGKIDYVPIDGEFWKIQIDHLTASRTHHKYSEVSHAVLDSTSNTLVLPEGANYFVNMYNTTYDKKIRMLKFRSCNVDDQPDLVLNIKDKTYILTAKDLMIELVQKDGSISCYLAIETRANLDRIVLGIPFLKSFYTIYDYVNKQVGLARSKNSEQGGSDDFSLMDLIDSKNGNSEDDNQLEKMLEIIRHNLNIDSEDEDSDTDTESDYDVCAVCRDGFSKKPPFETVCGHKFHLQCILDFYSNNQQGLSKTCFICFKRLQGLNITLEDAFAHQEEEKRQKEKKLFARSRLDERMSLREKFIINGVRSSLAYTTCN